MASIVNSLDGLSINQSEHSRLQERYCDLVFTFYIATNLRSRPTASLARADHRNEMEVMDTSEPLTHTTFTMIAESQFVKSRAFTEILSAFKEKFPNEPKGRVQKGYSIRSKTTWEEVLRTLNDSAVAYAAGGGSRGALNKVKEVIQDKADIVERVSRLVPDVDYAKPVVGTLTFILDVCPETA